MNIFSFSFIATERDLRHSNVTFLKVMASEETFSAVESLHLVESNKTLLPIKQTINIHPIKTQALKLGFHTVHQTVQNHEAL